MLQETAAANNDQVEEFGGFDDTSNEVWDPIMNMWKRSKPSVRRPWRPSTLSTSSSPYKSPRVDRSALQIGLGSPPGSSDDDEFPRRSGRPPPSAKTLLSGIFGAGRSEEANEMALGSLYRTGQDPLAASEAQPRFHQQKGKEEAERERRMLLEDALAAFKKEREDRFMQAIEHTADNTAELNEAVAAATDRTKQTKRSPTAPAQAAADQQIDNSTGSVGAPQLRSIEKLESLSRTTREEEDRQEPVNSHRQRLIRFYSKYAPDRLVNVDATLLNFSGRESKMFDLLVTKYGPEPLSAEEEAAAEAVRIARATAPPLRATTPPPAAPDPATLAVYRARLLRFYNHYDQSKAKNVDNILSKYAGAEEDLFQVLLGKYGPEPLQDSHGSLHGSVWPDEAVVPTAREEQQSPLVQGEATSQQSKSTPSLDQPPESEPPMSPPQPVKLPVPQSAPASEPPVITSTPQLTAQPMANPQHVVAAHIDPAPLPDTHATLSPPQPYKEERDQQHDMQVVGTLHIGTQDVRDEQEMSDAAMNDTTTATNEPFKDEEQPEEEVATDPFAPDEVDGVAKTETDAAVEDEKEVVVAPSNPAEVLAGTVVSSQTQHDYRGRLTRFYQRYAPHKVVKVDIVLKSCAGREEDMFVALVGKYGPEPTLEDQVIAPEPPTALAVPAPPTIVAASPSSQTLSPAPAGKNPPPTQTPASNAPVAPEVTPEVAASMTKDRLRRFYAFYAPVKLPEVDAVLENYKGREDEMFEQLTIKYGPEPVKNAVHPTSDNNEHRARLIRFYQRYAPQKVREVDSILNNYAGREEEMFSVLSMKYGPEPPGARPSAAKQPGGPTAGLSSAAKQPPTVGSSGAAKQPPAKSAPQKATTINKLPPSEQSTGSGPVSPPAKKVPPKAPLASSAKVTIAGGELGAPPKKMPPPPGQGHPQAGNGKAPPPSGPPSSKTPATETAGNAKTVAKKAPAKGPSKAPQDYPNRERLTRFYARYSKDKIKDVDMILASFEGREERMFKSLVEKYGPEPKGPMPASLMKSLGIQPSS